MKKYKMLLIVVSVFFVLGLAGCGSGSNSVTPFDKHSFNDPAWYITEEEGATAYDGCGDHFDSPYWKPLDVYNMESNDTLTIIPKFETYQQSSEFSCGACSALMVLKHYGNTDFDEAEAIKKGEVSDETGVGVDGLEKLFKGIGWDVERSKPGKETFSWETDDAPDATFAKWVQDNLKEGTPIMIDWLDWSGHWQVIIGYDTMGTDDHFGDDVLIVADPYDTSDHYQDGYFTVPAERFFYMWKEGVTTKEGPEPQPWIIAKPTK